LAGYDNEKFRSPDDVYAKLAASCKYDRPIKSAHSDIKEKQKTMEMDGHADHSNMSSMEKQPSASELTAVFEDYFAIKDALIKTDAIAASAKASALSMSVKAVDMSKLYYEEHIVWMKINKDLDVSAQSISKSKDISKQREAFVLLSKNFYQLAKVSKLSIPIYYQYCPMYKANWLILESIRWHQIKIDFLDISPTSDVLFRKYLC